MYIRDEASRLYPVDMHVGVLLLLDGCKVLILLLVFISSPCGISSGYQDRDPDILISLDRSKQPDAADCTGTHL